MIVDKLGRRFNNLRVSLTAACNYACKYCVPDGKRLMKAKYELPATAMLKAVTLLQQAAGIDKIRIESFMFSGLFGISLPQSVH